MSGNPNPFATLPTALIYNGGYTSGGVSASATYGGGYTITESGYPSQIIGAASSMIPTGNFNGGSGVGGGGGTPAPTQGGGGGGGGRGGSGGQGGDGGNAATPVIKLSGVLISLMVLGSAILLM